MLAIPSTADVVKIDVEGAEASALMGLAELNWRVANRFEVSLLGQPPHMVLDVGHRWVGYRVCTTPHCAILRAAMGRSTTSIRLDDGLRRQLAAQAAAETTTVTELIERYAREGLACAAHPGIVFKPGPARRRAALAGGPDVWEIVAALRHTTGTESERMFTLAEQFGIHERQVAIAFSYAAAHREEIEARIDANDQALVRAESVAGERQRLLA